MQYLHGTQDLEKAARNLFVDAEKEPVDIFLRCFPLAIHEPATQAGVILSSLGVRRSETWAGRQQSAVKQLFRVEQSMFPSSGCRF